MITRSALRVPANTQERIDRRIRRETEQRLAYYAEHRDEIPGRLAELDDEWDVERALQVNASTLMVAGSFLGLTRGRQWFLLTGAVGGFLLQHALQGWCPPLPLMRRLHVRTVREIDAERYALKALRGDFNSAAEEERGAAHEARKALEAVTT